MSLNKIFTESNLRPRINATFNNVTIDGNKIVNGNEEITGDLTVDGLASFDGGVGLGVGSDLIAGGDLTVGGNTQLEELTANGDIFTFGDLEVSGVTTLGTTLIANDATSFTIEYGCPILTPPRAIIDETTALTTEDANRIVLLDQTNALYVVGLPPSGTATGSKYTIILQSVGTQNIDIVTGGGQFYGLISDPAGNTTIINENTINIVAGARTTEIGDCIIITDCGNFYSVSATSPVAGGITV